MSILFLYTCPVLVIRGTQRGQPRPLFIFTLRGKHWAMLGGVEVINRTAATAAPQASVTESSAPDDNLFEGDEAAPAGSALFSVA